MSGERVAIEADGTVLHSPRAKRHVASDRRKDGPREGYRADIDGLRAIAVALVLIFHTGISPLRGGFIGVDVFFVISGFLITRLLRADIERGTFSVAGFYERRARRILPAMLVVLAVTLLLAPFLLFPSELRQTVLTAIAALLSASNLFLLQSAGYFAADVTSQPLIHTWSLGVEEQFYLFFPLVMLVLARRRSAVVGAAIAAMLVVSFLGGVLLTAVNRDIAYYFPLTRAWELLIGSLLVYVPVPRFRPILAEVGALLALGLLLACGYKFHAGLAFPGIYAAVPCIATAALIGLGARNKSVVTRLLSSSPFTWFGKISYSVYLWHWPILIYYQLAIGRFLTVAEALSLCVLITIVAYLSWRFVEQPFRGRGVLPDRRAVWRWAAISCILLGFSAVGLWLYSAYASQGEGNRIAAYLNYNDAPVYRRGSCFLFGHIDRLPDFNRDLCLRPSSVKQNILLVGDSHAAHLWSGLNSVLPGSNVMQATATGCKPVTSPRGERGCTDLIAMVLGKFIEEHHVDTLVLSARWIASDIPDVVRTIRDVQDKVGRIVVFGPIVEYDHALPRLLGQAIWRGDQSLLARGRNPEQQRTDLLLSKAVASARAQYVSTYSILCGEGQEICTTTQDGIPLQWDYGHLTAEGSAFVARKALEAGLK